MLTFWRLAGLLPLAALALLPPAAQAIKRKPSKEATGHPELVLISAFKQGSRQRLKGSGALIGPRAVLTAGHCAKGFDSWEVLAPYARGQRGRSRRAVIHPQYQAGKEYDLAVLILDDPIRLDKPPPALHGGSLLRIDTKLTVIGRVNNGDISDDRLYRANVTLVSLRDYFNQYFGNPKVCEHGDSGGPVFVAGKEDEIVAVVSAILDEGRFRVPTDIFVPIDRAKRDWILRQVPKAR